MILGRPLKSCNNESDSFIFSASIFPLFDERVAQNVPNYKDDLIVDFNRIENTHDTVLLQEEIKDLRTETMILKEKIATLQSTLQDKENAQIELVNRL